MAYWRFVSDVRDRRGLRATSRDRGWGLSRARAEHDLRRKLAKEGCLLLAISEADGPHWPPGRGPIWYRRGLPMPPEAAAAIARPYEPAGPAR